VVDFYISVEIRGGLLDFNNLQSERTTMNNVTPIKKQPISVNLDAMPDEICGADVSDQPFQQGQKCDGKEFTKIFMFKRLSALVSPNGMEQVVQLEFLKCLKCGAVKRFKQ